MSKATRPEEAADVLASIRKLVADEAGRAEETAAALSTESTSADAESPDPMSEPVPQEERDLAEHPVEPLSLVPDRQFDDDADILDTHPPDALTDVFDDPEPEPEPDEGDAAGAPPTFESGVFRSQAAEPGVEEDAQEKTAATHLSRRFAPWEADALAEGLKVLDTPKAPRKGMKLLLTEEFRVPERNEAQFRSLRQKIAPVLPGYAEDSDVPGSLRALNADFPETSKGPVPDLSAVVAAEVSAQIAKSQPAETAVSADPAGDDEDLYIDEAMLRAIVAEIVRDELQGALGERITRNVRKLVRSELNRALEARALDKD